MMKSILNFKVKHKDGQIYDMHNLGLWVESFHIYSPNAERETFVMPGQHGEKLKKSRIGKRRIDITIQIEQDDYESFDKHKHLIYTIFYTEEPFEIIRDIEPDKKLFALQEGDYDISNITLNDGEFSLTLTMLDPLIYGQDINLVIGPTYNTFLINVKEKSPWFSQTVFNENATQYILEEAQGGKIIINYDFIPGDILEINSKTRKITLNGNLLNFALSIHSVWFYLKGQMQLKANHVTTLTYTENFL